MLQSGLKKLMPYIKIANDLVQTGVSVVENFLSAGEVAALLNECRLVYGEGKFQTAGIGRGAAYALQTEIRRDEIFWFEPTQLLQAQSALWNRLEDLRNKLNQELFLNIATLEGHFAIYPPGGFYRRHVDRFRSDDARVISIVIYLNESWEPGDGGELEVFFQNTARKVEPRAGTLVCFRSECIEHEVHEAKVKRVSFAGWFRHR
jgi:SM-20-related protein